MVDNTWREFERLAARIESTLAPHGAVVNSPDRVPDLLTGSLREVDASIRYKIGTVPILITVECRRRSEVQDDTWIEQLATKKEKVGAARTIAISASGFSGPAQRTAAAKGIELRQLQEVTAADIERWLFPAAIVHLIRRSVLQTFNAIFFGEPGDSGSLTLRPEVVGAFNADIVAAKVFLRGTDGVALSVNDIWLAAQRARPDLYDGVPENGTKVRRNVRIELPRGLIRVETNNGPRSVKTLALGFDLYVEVQQKGPNDPRFYSYSAPDGTVVNRVEFGSDLGGTGLDVAFQSVMGTKDVLVTIVGRHLNPPKAAESETPDKDKRSA